MRRKSSFLNSQIRSRAGGSTRAPRSGPTPPPTWKGWGKPKKQAGRYESIVRRFNAQKKRGGDGHFREGLKDRIKEVGGSIDRSGGKPKLNLPRTTDTGMERTTTTKPVRLPPGDGSQRDLARAVKRRRRYFQDFPR